MWLLRSPVDHGPDDLEAVVSAARAEAEAEDAASSGERRLRRDQVGAFRPAILGIRGGTTAVSVALSSPAFVQRHWWTIGWCALIVA